MMREVMIVSAVRTPVGAFHGALSAVPVGQLLGIVIREAMSRAGVGAKDVDEVTIDNMLRKDFGKGLLKEVSAIEGLRDSTGVLTANVLTLKQVCSSHLALAMDAVASHATDAVVVSGAENASLAFPQAKEGVAVCRIEKERRLGWTLRPSCADCHEAVLARSKVSREEVQMYIFGSYHKALQALAKGKFAEEIVPVEVLKEGSKRTIIDKDEISAVSGDQSLSVYTSARVSDGASAIIIMSAEKAHELRVRPLARVIAWELAFTEPTGTLTSAAIAIPRLLRRAGLEKRDIDLYEIDEVCSTCTVSVLRRLGIDWSNVNVHGGSLAFGWPLGAAAGILVTSLLSAIKDLRARRGIMSFSLGGTYTTSLVLERC